MSARADAMAECCAAWVFCLKASLCFSCWDAGEVGHALLAVQELPWAAIWYFEHTAQASLRHSRDRHSLSERENCPSIRNVQQRWCCAARRCSRLSALLQTLHGASPEEEDARRRKRPDGDVELLEVDRGFRFPSCPQCGGILKPDVVYFGDSVPKQKALLADRMAEDCDAVLLLGTSCSTLSVFRLVQAVYKRGGAVAAVNVGPTRADQLLSLSVEARVGEVLMRLATHNALLLERPVR